MSATMQLSSKTTVTDAEASQIHLHSSLAEEYRQEIEDLFFFNPKQAVVRERVREHVKRYGTPVIGCHDGLVSLELSQVEHAQALFIMMGEPRAKLIGVLLYVREGDCLRVLYMALKPVYTRTWRKSCSVIACVFDQLRKLAKNIKGVCQVEYSLAGKDVTVRL